MAWFVLFCTLATWVSYPSLARSEVYRCEKNGTITFSDIPCEQDSSAKIGRNKADMTTQRGSNRAAPSKVKATKSKVFRPVGEGQERARGIIAEALAQHILQRTEPVLCKYGESEKKTYMLCEYDLGGWHKKTLWEVKELNGDFLFLAINGAAITALENLDKRTDFMKHPSPNVVNIPLVLDTIGRTK